MDWVEKSSLCILLWIFIILCFFTNRTHQEVTFYLVPHTHQDPGWLQTFDEYAKRATRKSFETFQKNVKDKFIYQEMSFLWDAIKNGAELTNDVLDRMEIVGGGWTLADEACPSYEDYITNMEVGHEYAKSLYKKANKELNIQSLWNIDPFGHSRTISLELAIDMGMKYVVLNRISRDLKEKWRQTKNLQFNWCVREDKCIFVHILSDHYAAPPGFHFDGDGNIDSLDVSEEDLAKKLCKHVQEVREFYISDHILAPYGDDFTHVSNKPIEKLWKVLKYINDYDVDKCSGVKFKISNLNEYFTALQDDIKKNNISIPHYEYADFFPYNQIPGTDDDYWTGYFTSHPTFKRDIRSTSDFLRTAEIVSSLHTIQDNLMAREGHIKYDFETTRKRLGNLRQLVSLLQHHDGVTGTSKSYVRDDYITMMNNATSTMKDEVSKSFTLLVGESHASQLKILDQKKILDVNPNEILPIVVMNNLGYPRSSFVSMRVSSDKINIFAVDENSNRRISLVKEIIKSQDEEYELHVYLSQVPAFGFKTFFLEYDANGKSSKEIIQNDMFNNQIENEFVKLIFNNNCVTSISVARPDLGPSESFFETISLKDELFIYTTEKNQGAYIFNADKQEEIQTSGRKVFFTNGTNISQVKIKFEDAKFKGVSFPVTIVYRLYKNIDISLDQLPVDITITSDFSEVSYENMDLVYRVSTEINNQNIFYTDSNGFDIVKRVYNSNVGISGNYFPATQSFWISDNHFTMSILLREAHGVSSIKNGTLELALGRQSKADDGKGVGQAIKEEVHPTVANFKLVFFQGGFERGKKYLEEFKLRNLARSFDHPFTLLDQVEKLKSVDDYKRNHILSLSPIQNMNEKLYITSFRPLLTEDSHDDEKPKFVLRLHNTDRQNAINSFNISGIFQLSDINISKIEEWTLTLLQKKDYPIDPENVSFSSNEIRTFVIELSKRQAPPSPPPIPPPTPPPTLPFLVYIMGGAIVVFFTIASILLAIFLFIGIIRRGWFKKQNQQWSLLNEFSENSSEEMDIFDDDE